MQHEPQQLHQQDVGNRKRAILNALVVLLTVLCVILYEEISAVAIAFRNFSSSSFTPFPSSSATTFDVNIDDDTNKAMPIVKREEENGEEDEGFRVSAVADDREGEDETQLLITEENLSKEEEEDDYKDDEDDEDEKDDVNTYSSSVYLQTYAKWMRKQQRKNMRGGSKRKRASTSSSSFFDLRKECHEKCLNGGKCDYFSGKCDCPVGFTGSMCEDEEQTFPCNDNLELRCSHACDATRALCVCGEGTKHPSRVLHQWPFL